MANGGWYIVLTFFPDPAGAGTVMYVAPETWSAATSDNHPGEKSCTPQHAPVFEPLVLQDMSRIRNILAPF